MIFDRQTWERFMEGYMVRDCTIGFEDGRLGFLLFEELDEDARMEDGFQIRILVVKLANPMETRFFSLSANGLGVGAHLSSAWAPRNTEFVGVGIGRESYSYKPKAYKGREDDIPHECRKLHADAYSEFDVGILKTVRVGPTVFAAGGPFRIFERLDGKRWKEHAGIPVPAAIGSADRETALEAIGGSTFNDLAGLSPDDLYAVGSRGTVWRRTGGQWKHMSFPSNLDLYTVAVAPDGTAYVTDIRGSVWKGKDEQWSRVVHADHMHPYQDSAWFEGRLYCANDSAGCFILEGSDMVPAHRAKSNPMPAHTAAHAHRLDVSPDSRQLLIAGMHGATLYDGRDWNVLFDSKPDT